MDSGCRVTYIGFWWRTAICWVEQRSFDIGLQYTSLAGGTFCIGWITGDNFGIARTVGCGFNFDRCAGHQFFSVVMAALDPNMIQTALLQVAEATKAASDAVKAVQQAQAKSSTTPSQSSIGGGVDWSKLINKPQVFEHATLEAEIKAFRD